MRAEPLLCAALNPLLKFEIIGKGQSIRWQETRHSLPRYGVTKGSRQMPKLYAFLKDESGATAIEYGLIAAGISVAIIAVVNGLGTNLNTKFSSISTQLK